MILDTNQCYDLSKHIQYSGGKVMFTNGCFDVFHIGHLNVFKYMNNLKMFTDDLIFVGINSDRSVKELKGENRPIFCQEHRAEIIDSVKYVDYVFIFDEVNVLPVIERIKPNILVKGGDSKQIVGEDFVKSYNGEVLRSPEIKNVSSTNIIEEVMKC